MTSITSSHNYNSLIGFQEHFYRESFYKVPCSRCFLPFSPSGRFCFPHGLHHSTTYSQTVMKTRPIFSSTVDDGNTIDPDNSDDATIDKGQSESGGVCVSICFIFNNSDLIQQLWNIRIVLQFHFLVMGLITMFTLTIKGSHMPLSL